MLSKREALGLILIMCVVGLIGIVAHHQGMLFCLFRRLTGIPCPCCGTTRACLAILRGDFAAAVGFNPLAVAVVFMGPFVLWLMTLRKTWPRYSVVLATILVWLAVFLNWAYLLFHDLSSC